MRLNELMRTNPVTITPQETVGEARSLMKRHGIRHLPVLDASRVVGVVSDRDTQIPEVVGVDPDTRWLDKALVGQVMSSPAVVMPPGATAKEAANRMRGNKIGCIPVAEDGRLMGIVTETDILEAFSRTVSGTQGRGSIRTNKGRAPR
jgi:acetoin utilization protein AcuB